MYKYESLRNQTRRTIRAKNLNRSHNVDEGSWKILSKDKRIKRRRELKKNQFDTVIKSTNLLRLQCQLRLMQPHSLAMPCLLLFALVVIAVDNGLIFSSHAQYSGPIISSSSSGGSLLSSATTAQQGYCDSVRLIRCQQDAVRDMQLAAHLGTGSSAAAAAAAAANLQQYQLNAGPPYSPAAKLREQQQQQLLLSSTSGQLTSLQATCRLIRSNLDCLLNTTPACYESGLQAAHNSDVILRAKRFLEHSGCNEPDPSWQVTFCYRAPEVRACEERYGFQLSSGSSLSVANASACLAYQAFKYCLDSHVRLNCKVYEIDMANEYLIDRAGDLSWRCPHSNNSNLLYSPSGHHQYGLSGAATLLSPSSGYDAYTRYNQQRGDQYLEQRPIQPSYVGSSGSGNNNLFSGSVVRPSGLEQQAWERFRNPYDDARFGISRLPSGGGGSGEVFDRLVAGGAGFDPDSSDCPIKAAPYARECEDTLIDEQRLARDSRDGNELQRRICCSLFRYRDCISRVVLDRCADSSPAAVELLMGIRRRELVLSCRGFNRDLCTGGALALASSPMLIALASIAAIYMTFKQQQQQQQS